MQNPHIKLMFSMLGVRPQSLHRIWAEQRSTSTAEGQHMCSRVPVHASHLAPKQVIHAQIFRNAHVLCIIFAAAPPLEGPVCRIYGQKWN